MGTRTQKRGDRRRSRTVGRIKRGGGNGGEPARSPLGRRPYAGRMAARSRAANGCGGVSETTMRKNNGAGTPCPVATHT